MDSFVELLKSLWEHHRNNVALAITWIGIVVVYVRKRILWRRKEFMSQVNFSLNYADAGRLMMRTLLETTAEKVWLNDFGAKLVAAAAQKTTVGHPFIALDDAKDQDFVNRAVLNVLSELFAESFVAASLGMPVKRANYCFALTCEKYAGVRTLKLRVIIIEEQTLLTLFGTGGAGDTLLVSLPHHQDRLKTLQGIHDMYVREKTTGRHDLGHVELGVVDRTGG